MVRIKEAVIVEGKYDKQRILSFADALVIETTGFDVFKNDETRKYIKSVAEKQGIVILTDSDRAGFRIRNHIKSFVPEALIKNAYIPEVAGKERRKNKPSCEGMLGVEGMDADILIAALKRSGCTVDGEKITNDAVITRKMLYDDGFLGKENSSELRKLLCGILGLPSKISTNALLKALNSVCSIDSYENAVKTAVNKRLSK